MPDIGFGDDLPLAFASALLFAGCFASCAPRRGSRCLPTTPNCYTGRARQLVSRPEQPQASDSISCE